jgi:hypothetical protein
MVEFDKQLEKIQEKLQELKKEAKVDCIIDKTDLFSIFNTTLMEKWIRKRVEWSKLTRSYEEKRKDKFRSLYQYYKTDFELKLSTKEEYQLFIESDSSYVVILSLSLSTKEVVKYIDDVIDTIKSRGWEIKNYLEYIKFVNGV